MGKEDMMCAFGKSVNHKKGEIAKEFQSGRF